MKLLKISFCKKEGEYEETSCDSEMICNLSEFKKFQIFPLYDFLNEKQWGYNLYLYIGDCKFGFLCSLKRNNTIRNIKELADDLTKFFFDNRKMLILKSNSYEEL